MSKGSTSSDAPFGTLLGYAPGGVAIYSSNYSSLNPQDYPDDATFRSYIGNEYMGHKWQCVEFARRFLFLTYGFVFTDVGMAYEIFSLRFLREVVNDNILPLQAFANGSRRPPIAGSLLIWQKGGEFKHTGHVAVITQLVGNKVRIAEQNVIHSPLPQGQQWTRELTLEVNDGRYTIKDTFADTEILGWMIQTADTEHSLPQPVLPGAKNFVKALLTEAAQRGVTVTTVVQNVNSRKTSVVLGEAEKVLYGKGFILDTLCGKTYAISPRSFYQVNHAQTEVLYGLAVEAAKLTGKEVVLDAYCGIGTIGLTAADHAKQVVGVELNRDAVQDAIGNAKHNGVKNARFFAADATRWIREAAAAGEKADVIFMDPPREGSTPEFLASVARMAPKRVVYVSCNPVTLARDLATLTKLGYKAEGFTPVDMFPHTEHIETVCALSKLDIHGKKPSGRR